MKITTTICRKLRLYSLLILSGSHWVSCNNNDNSNKDDQNSALTKKDTLHTDTIIVKVSAGDIKNNSFYLPADNPLLIAVDSLRIAVMSNDEGKTRRLSFIHPVSGNEYESIDVVKLSPTIKQDQFQYDPDETEFLKNNGGSLKTLVHGAGKYSNEKYVAAGFGQSGDKIIYIGTRHDFVIEDVTTVFFNGSTVLIDDSVFNISKTGHYKLTINDHGQAAYSLIDSGEYGAVLFSNEKNYDYTIYRPAEIFPCYDKLYFIANSTGADEQTFLVSYDLKSRSKKKYIIPGTATQFWFAKNCIFFSLYYLDEKKSLYSYIPY